MTGGALQLETRTNVLARDGLPAAATFVWDEVEDRLVSVFAAADPSAADGAADGYARVVRQYLHGTGAYDDPIEVRIASTAGATPVSYTPVLDEAGNGSLSAVVDANGNLIERVIYADSYGDEPRYLHGAVVDHIGIRDVGANREIVIHFSETVDTSSASNVRVAAIDATGAILRTAGAAARATEDDHTIVWRIASTDWSAFVTNATSLQIGVGTGVRFEAWGSRGIMPAAAWQITTGQLTSSADYPVVATYSVAQIASQLQSSAGAALFDVNDIYTVASTDSDSKLLFDFQSLPFREPASGRVYARARWLDTSTGSWLTPDPEGYRDSSNLYAFAANDPVNGVDPTGRSAADVWDWTKAGAGLLAGGVEGVVRLGIDAVHGTYSAFYNGVGAMAYEFTGNEQYREQYDAHMQTTAAINHLVAHPIDSAVAVKKHLDKTYSALAQKGDTYGIGREFGKEIGPLLLGAEAVEAAELGEGAEAARVAERGLLAESETAGSAAAAGEAERFTTSEMRELVRREMANGATKEEAFARIRAGEACFVAGTLVATIDGDKPIEQMKVGDRVLSRDMSTGFLRYSSVVDAFVRSVEFVVYLQFDDDRIGASPDHPFWVTHDGRAPKWTRAADVRPQDLVLLADGNWLNCRSVHTVREHVPVFNFEVHENHDYFVGAEHILVHNAQSGRCAFPGGVFNEGASQNRGLVWRTEKASMSEEAQVYESGTAGARSDVASGRRLAPTLRYDNPFGGRNEVRFDGLEAERILIDRKISVYSSRKAKLALRRQAAAIHQNPEFSLRYELPTRTQVRRLQKLLAELQINDRRISVRLAP